MTDRPRQFGPKTGRAAIVVLTAVFCSAVCRGSEDARTSLTLIPPSPVTDKIQMDIRAAVWNHADSPRHYQVSFYLNEESDTCLLHRQDIAIAPRACKGVKFTWPTAGRAGTHKILFTAAFESQTLRTSRPLEILPSQTRSTNRIEGAWFEFYHWSEAEGRLWNKEIKTLADDEWKELITGMHDIGMNIVVIQDTCYNPNRYVGKHTMEKDGFTGQAFYPSAIYPKYPGISAADPLEAVLTQADEHGMHVMVGVGGYAWFDYTPGSLQWHKTVADELWNKYGRHPSFYGWYVSEEIAGSLGADDMRRRQIVDFFREFTAHVRSLAPDKPVMLATNCHLVKQAGDYYPKLLEHLDILCPFGFHRMPPNDYTGEEVAAILQSHCDAAGAHLWMDMEVFLFGPQSELFPRPIDGVIDDLMRFPNFEKICCYSYTGLMNSPRQSRTPGGPATVALYSAYKQFLAEGPPNYTTEHAAVGCGVEMIAKPSTRYSKGDLTDGRIAPPDFGSDGWLGFENQDLHAVVDLGKPRAIAALQARFLRNDTAAIALPSRVEFAISKDGDHYASAAVIEHAASDLQIGPSVRVYAKDGIGQTARYIRIRAESAAQWLFVDEIIVNPVHKPSKER